MDSANADFPMTASPFGAGSTEPVGRRTTVEVLNRETPGRFIYVFFYTSVSSLPFFLD
jgi:hypothetical protein